MNVFFTNYVYSASFCYSDPVSYTTLTLDCHTYFSKIKVINVITRAIKKLCSRNMYPPGDYRKHNNYSLFHSNSKTPIVSFYPLK